MANYPGHAGIFIGRWRDLPLELRTRYRDVLDNVLIRSSDWGLVDSYLVVDSMGGGGVQLRSFVEQFTGYLPTNARAVNLEQADGWESSQGSAIAWPDLSVDDPRRWRIVEEALKAARARVPYDDGHWQFATTLFQSDDTSYENLEWGLDCIALAHIVYWRGASIDIDVSWAPWHAPDQLYSAAISRNMLRTVNLSEARWDALALGRWTVTQSERHYYADGEAIDPSYDILRMEPAAYSFWADGSRFHVGAAAANEPDADFWSRNNWIPSIQRNPNGRLNFNIDMQNGSFEFRGVINSDGSATVAISGDMRNADAMNPDDRNHDGLPDSAYSMRLTAEKIRDMPSPVLRAELGMHITAVEF